MVKDKVNRIVRIGIIITNQKGRFKTPYINKFKITLKNPIKIAVTSPKTYVANVFSKNDLRLNSPIIKSLAVLETNGAVIFPLNENNGGMININREKLLKGNIKRVRIIPAKISPTIEIISNGNISLTILPLVSSCSTAHHCLLPIPYPH